mgnify:CR=1 FL=1
MPMQRVRWAAAFIASQLFVFSSATAVADFGTNKVPALPAVVTELLLADAGNAAKPPKEIRRRDRRADRAHRRSEGLSAIEHRSEPWRRRSEQRRLLEEARQDSAHRREYDYLRDGLLAHEGGHLDGHTLRKHVSVSDPALSARLRHEKVQQTAQKNPKTPQHGKAPTHLSTFHSLRHAERLIERTLSDKRNQQRLRDWLRTRPTGGELVLTRQFRSEPTGKVLDRKSKRIQPGTGVTVVLRPTKSQPGGWQIKTAYPTR